VVYVVAVVDVDDDNNVSDVGVVDVDDDKSVLVRIHSNISCTVVIMSNKFLRKINFINVYFSV